MEAFDAARLLVAARLCFTTSTEETKRINAAFDAARTILARR
jgi:hypothetical protein